MANWAEMEITLWGDKNSLESIIKSYQENPDIDIAESDIIEKRNSISIYGQVSGSMDTDLLLYKVLKQPISMLFVEREPGVDFTHLIRVVNGKLVQEEHDSYWSDLAFSLIEKEDLENEFLDDYYDFQSDDISAEEYYKDVIELFLRNGVVLDLE